MSGASIIMFFYGLALFLFNSEGGEKDKGRKHMLYGVIGLFIIFSVWGVISIITDTIDVIAK